jgi:carboxypeptidase family protein
MKKLLFLLAAASLSMALSADARVPIGTLAGSVLDAQGQPVSNAAVTIQTSDGSEPFATHTDTNGHFQIARLETGQYDLRASSAGLISDWTKRVMVHANKTTEVLLRLPARKA